MTIESHISDPAASYADAPSLVSEVIWVTKHSRCVGEQDREFWIRKAAAFDRIAIKEAKTFAPATAAQAIRVAERVARQLVEHDITHAGLSLKGAELIFGEDCRAYVRQEYHAWSCTQDF
ncbi:hypothetical protein [Streptomyces griseocarneus]|uniref:hypothetical protein n=1 Tax=Streptomyces griseocarneus TaxID=51201 RepID=UPI00167ED018|nr:hypothetical protein [Streptomyces griseocarneus]MBZ6473220.1 hypothetical protein [Streptomyces griseocarneus]GHG60519.1 hypothetical protein GCM10018779_27900 [Streptomyces griseocarneus]